MACQKFDQFPNIELDEHSTILLAHRGGGNSGHPENSFAAAKAGLKALGGIELDLQLSADGTLWMAHDADLPDCESGDYVCFSQHYDHEITDLSACVGHDFSPGQLEHVFQEVKKNYPDAVLSLDVKPWVPCSISDLSVPLKMRDLADEIDALIRSLELSNRVFVESQNLSFLTYLKGKNPDIECHILAFSNIEKASVDALKNGLDGVSFKYDPEIELDLEPLKEKGLTIQLWTVNTPENLEKALALKPHTIQTDELSFKKFMP